MVTGLISGGVASIGYTKPVIPLIWVSLGMSTHTKLRG